MKKLKNSFTIILLVFLFPISTYSQESNYREKEFVQTKFFTDTLSKLIENFGEEILIIKQTDTFYFDFIFKNIETDSCFQILQNGVWKVVVKGSEPQFFFFFKYNHGNYLAKNIDDILINVANYIRFMNYSQEQSVELIKSIMRNIDY